MRKPISILLLCLLLYNTMGYYLYYQYRQTQARSQLRNLLNTNTLLLSQKDIDQKVLSGQWVVFPIVIPLYHQLDRQTEPIEGEFFYQGRVYEKAMRRIKNDTLYVYCVNNRLQEQVKNEFKDHINTHITDHSTNPTTKNQKTVKSSFLHEYLSVEKAALATRSFLLLITSINYQVPSIGLPALDTPFPPPKQV